MEIPEAEAEAFVGPRAAYYIDKWRGVGGPKGPALGFHVPAFLLGMVWLLYRRMYRFFWILLGSWIGLTVVLTLLFPALPGSVYNTLTIAVCATLGTFGNYLYYRHALRIFRETGGGGLAELTAKGGVRWWPPLILLGVAIALFVLAAGAAPA